MTAITQKATLGQKITFNQTLIRHRLHDQADTREWLALGCKPQEGILIGVRTLWNGTVYTECMDAEDGGGYSSSFTPRDHVPAFLVAVSLGRKPILIPQHAAVAAQ